MREIASLDEDRILRIRGVGTKTKAEVARVLRSHGVAYVLWDKFHTEEE